MIAGSDKNVKNPVVGAIMACASFMIVAMSLLCNNAYVMRG